MKHIQTFEGFLSINESKNIDFKNSKNKILVGLKTNLLKDMMDRYEHVIDGDMIHFFDTKGVHFGTLFDLETRYQELRHDGRLDDKGWLR
jgi:hypothetical protein